MADPKPFTFICGSDDFLVSRLGQERFDERAKEIEGEFSCETISGFANTVAEVEAAVNRFRGALQTIFLFGEQRSVWLKDVNFLADSKTGRADGTETQLEELQRLLAANNPSDVAILVTAAPIDRRRRFIKWCEQNGDFTLVVDNGKTSALADLLRSEAQKFNVEIQPRAIELLLTKIGPNARLLFEEIRKLCSYVDAGQPITKEAVKEITPNMAEGDFFEAAEAFFHGDLQWTLAALHRHFFAGGDARAIITTLQNRNRLLLQARILVDAGDARLSGRGLDGLKTAASRHQPKFADAAAKTPYNLFTQNPYYIKNLVNCGRLPTTRRLIDNQQEMITAFTETVQRPHEQEDILREMAVRCLAAR